MLVILSTQVGFFCLFVYLGRMETVESSSTNDRLRVLHKYIWKSMIVKLLNMCMQFAYVRYSHMHMI